MPENNVLVAYLRILGILSIFACCGKKIFSKISKVFSHYRKIGESMRSEFFNVHKGFRCASFPRIRSNNIFFILGWISTESLKKVVFFIYRFWTPVFGVQSFQNGLRFFWMCFKIFLMRVMALSFFQVYKGSIGICFATLQCAHMMCRKFLMCFKVNKFLKKWVFFNFLDSCFWNPEFSKCAPIFLNLLQNFFDKIYNATFFEFTKD